MLIGNKEVESIIITDSEDGVLAVISDTEIIEHDGYRVLLNKKEGNENGKTKDSCRRSSK